MAAQGIGITTDYVVASTSDFPTMFPLQPTSGGDIEAAVAKIAAETTLAVSPLALNFGQVTIGSSQDLSLTLQNTGETTLTGTVGVPPSPFSVVAGGGGFSQLLSGS